jgi:FkbM family methyltransferase
MPTLNSIIKAVLPSRLVHYIQQKRLEKTIASFPPRTVQHHYGSHRLSVKITDPIADAWYGKDWDELPEITFLKQTRLKPGACIFDLGAHQGIVAMMLAREVGPLGRVVAVEGAKHNAGLAQHNLHLNQIKNVNLLHAIVGDAAGKEVVFSNTLNGSVSNSGVGELVEAVSIDSLADQYGVPDIVFLDIEGFESHALAGASAVIASKTDFCIEVHENCGLENHGTKESVLSHFPPSTHECFISFPEGNPFQPWLPGAVLPTERFWLIALASK